MKPHSKHILPLQSLRKNSSAVSVRGTGNEQPLLGRTKARFASRRQRAHFVRHVRSGTSRIVVLRGDQLPGDSAARERKILHLLTNELAEEGADRNHYQSNKAAVVGPGDGTNAFSFHFYQGVPHSRRLFTRMECSNAASASAVAAGVFGLVSPKQGNSVCSINLATHQHVETTPAFRLAKRRLGRTIHASPSLWSNFTRHGTMFRIVHGGMTITGNIVRHGNVFVMANIAPQRVDEELVRRLAELGDDFARRSGHPGAPAKVLVYRVRDLEGQAVECEAACYSEGQQHHSFPGSAAMAMCAFFSVSGLVDLPEEWNAETQLRLFHPSGTMTAHSQLRRSQHWEVVSTYFETPVRLLGHGTVELPR